MKAEKSNNKTIRVFSCRRIWPATILFIGACVLVLLLQNIKNMRIMVNYKNGPFDTAVSVAEIDETKIVSQVVEENSFVSTDGLNEVEYNDETLRKQVTAAVEWFKKKEFRKKELKKKLLALAVKGDERSVCLLTALADEDGFFPMFAVPALGKVPGREHRELIARKLREKFHDSNNALVRLALLSFAQMMREDAVSELADFIRENRTRSDGFGLEVCSAAVEALGLIDSPAAVFALMEELKRVREPNWLPDYGSTVVQALQKRPTSEVRAALSTYADHLQEAMPGADNPPGQAYITEKIMEARTSIEKKPWQPIQWTSSQAKQ